MSFNFTPVRKLMLCAATAASFAVAAPLAAVQAQPASGPYADQGGPSDEITVYGPRHRETDPYTGAPIETVRISRVVYYGDLDLGTHEGARMLRSRVARAAQETCNRFSNGGIGDFYVDDDSTQCVRIAYREAMDQTPVSRYSADWYGQ